jgi:hypothetical protein
MAHEYCLSDENRTVLEVLIPLNHRRGVKPGNNRQVISGIPANRLFEETRSGTVQRLFHGRPPLSEISNGPQSGTIDAAGGRPHQQSLDGLKPIGPDRGMVLQSPTPSRRRRSYPLSGRHADGKDGGPAGNRTQPMTLG